MAAEQLSAYDGIDFGMNELALEDSSWETSTVQYTEQSSLPTFDPYASDSADSVATWESSTGSRLEVDKCFWGALPEDIRNAVLKKLPPAAYCRFRCVCRGWKRLLSPSPDWTRARAHYTLVTARGNSEPKSRIYCHSEEKFFSLPFSASLFKEMDLALHLQEPEYMGFHPIAWDLLDVDGGLFCYSSASSPMVADLCVCNPLTNSVRLISVVIQGQGWWKPKVKLLVDQKSKTFKIVLVDTDQYMTCTGIYDSAKSSWVYSESDPITKIDIFKWRNVIYGYNSFLNRPEEMFFLALDMESGQWIRTQVELPLHKNLVQLTIGSDQKQLTLVGSYSDRPYISVWKLKIDGTCRAPDFSSWEDLWTRQEGDMQGTLAGIRGIVTGTSCGAGYICFLIMAYSGPGSNTPTNVFLKYSHVTKRHTLIALGNGSRLLPPFFHRWEPSSEMEVGRNIEHEFD